MSFVIFLAIMLAAALISLTVLFSRASEGRIHLRRGGRTIQWDPPTRF